MFCLNCMKRRQWVFCLADLHSTAAGDGLMISAPCATPLVPTKRLVIVIILDKLAFANKEADFLIWSLKGRGSADDQVMKYFYVAASLVSLLPLWRRGDRVETEIRIIQRGGHGDVVNIIGFIIRGVSVMRYFKHMQNVYKKPTNPKYATALHRWLHDITRKIKQYLAVSRGRQHYIQHCYTPPPAHYNNVTVLETLGPSQAVFRRNTLTNHAAALLRKISTTILSH